MWVAEGAVYASTPVSDVVWRSVTAGAVRRAQQSKGLVYVGTSSSRPPDPVTEDLLRARCTYWEHVWSADCAEERWNSSPVANRDRVYVMCGGSEGIRRRQRSESLAELRGLERHLSPALPMQLFVGSGSRCWRSTPRRGTTVWRRSSKPLLRANTDFESSPAVANGVVFVGTVCGYDGLYAFDADTGAVLWNGLHQAQCGLQRNRCGGVFSSPAVAKDTCTSGPRRAQVQHLYSSDCRPSRTFVAATRVKTLWSESGFPTRRV